MANIDFHQTVPAGGLIQWALAARPGRLSSICPCLRQAVMRLLDACYDPDGQWPFRESPQPDASHNMETLTWALNCFRFIDAQDRLKRVRDTPGLLSKVDAFYDPQLMIYQDDNRQEAGHVGAWHFHNDSVMRMGLAEMGVPPRPQPRGVERLPDFPWAPQVGDDLEAWMQGCWDYDPRAGTKEIIQYLRLYQTLLDVVVDEHVLAILRFLTERRDMETGYIGIPRSGDLGWAMRGHRNNILHTFLDAGLREPPDIAAKVMESTLSLQREDGLFHDGSMCANMDAIEILAEYYLQTGRFGERVLASTRRCIRALFEQLYIPEYGGFLYEMPGERNAMWLVNGASFALRTLRYWQAIDPTARFDLCEALREIGAHARM